MSVTAPPVAPSTTIQPQSPLPQPAPPQAQAPPLQQGIPQPLPPQQPLPEQALWSPQPQMPTQQAMPPQQPMLPPSVVPTLAQPPHPGPGAAIGPPGSPPSTGHFMPNGQVGAAPALNNGRDKIHWGPQVWERLDKAVHDEMMRARVNEHFFPIRVVEPRTTAVPLDLIRLPNVGAPGFSVDEGATSPLNEYWVEFSMTPQQVDQEATATHASGHSTAQTLATRAANLLAQAEDRVIFEGANALASVIFTGGSVLNRGAPPDTGLLNLPGLPLLGGNPLPTAVREVTVDLTQAGAPDQWGANTFGAVADAIAVLQAAGQYGPYACVMHTKPFSDTYAPVAGGGTLAITADRIHPLTTAGFYSSGTLPIQVTTTETQRKFGGPASYVGVVLSLGGNTMDLVIGLDATTAFRQQDQGGNYIFGVVERFALRLKDPTAVVMLDFQ